MAGNLKKLVVCAVMALGGAAMAQDEAPAREPVKAPSSEAVKSTWDYFYKGQGQGLVLVETKLCSEVEKASGPNQFECAAELDPNDIKLGTKVMLWQSYLVPQGDVIENVMVQTKHNGVVRETTDVPKLEGKGMRTRSWPYIRLNKKGDWTITLMRGEEVLKTFDVKVN